MRISGTLMLVLICALGGAPACGSRGVARSRRAAALAARCECNGCGALWAAALSCESCGRECASACGTRHFRACCFNYLRRKRPDGARRPQLQPAQLKLQLWLAKTSEELRWHRAPSPDAAELLQLLAGSAVDQQPGLEQSSAEPALEQAPSPTELCISFTTLRSTNIVHFPFLPVDKLPPFSDASRLTSQV